MIKIGIAGVPLAIKGDGTGEGIKYLSRIGLDAMEVQFVRRVSMKEKTAFEVGEIARQCNVILSVHAPYMLNLASENSTIITESLGRLKLAIDRAWDLGARIVVFHSAYYTKKYTRDETYEMVRQGCLELLDYIKEKQRDVLLGVELMGRQSQFGTVDELHRLKHELNGVLPVVDFAHLNARCDGCMKVVEDYSSILKRLFTDKDYIHIHFSGIEFSRGNERRHLPVDFEQFRLLMRAIEQTGFDATIICESPLLEKDALQMKELSVRDL